VIQGNTITNLVGGGWVHAIGLEANTPGVLERRPTATLNAGSITVK